jgi:Bifunctional DNA primase/polymerase, N-terminal
MTCDHFRFSAGTPGITELGLGVAAMVYARLGFAVLPLDRGGKRPHRMLGREGGVYNATTGSGQIEHWWRADPAANIGVATGSVSKLVVVDLDVKAGNDGPGSWAQFLRGCPPDQLPRSPLVHTPSGGQHAWLRTPDHATPVPERPGILPGVDVKGDGGLVVAPPSMQLIMPVTRDREQSGAQPVPVAYSWAGGTCPCEAPPAPGWLLPWLASAPATGQPGQVAGDDLDVGQLTQTGAPVGERNRTYYRLACSLFRKLGTSGPGPAVVIESVRRAWQAGDTNGMPWSEILVICESARRFIERQQASEEALYNRYAGWFRN